MMLLNTLKTLYSRLSPATCFAMFSLVVFMTVAQAVTAQQNLSQCNDGIDNDGDGLVDWQQDVGCFGANDNTERAGTRTAENGWTTFDLSVDSNVIFVSSSEGKDSNDGLSATTPVASVHRARRLIREGFPDFVLFKRGDIWRNETLEDRVSINNVLTYTRGRSAHEKLVFSSYGDSEERPVFEIDRNFFHDIAEPSENIAFVGLSFISYKKEPGAAGFDGLSGGSIYIGPSIDTRSKNVLLEDLYVKYGEIVLKHIDNLEVRRNVVYGSYKMGTCIFDANGDLQPIGATPTGKPSGLYMESVTSGLIEDNTWDRNGWNPDIPVGDASNPGACANAYNHNVYSVDSQDVIMRNEISLRSSSIGFKISGGVTFTPQGERLAVDNLTIDNSLFAEGEIGISMVGNGNLPDTHINSTVSNNVFTDIGRTRPTRRSLAWGITIGRNNNVHYLNNTLVNPIVSSQAYAFSLESPTVTDVLLKNNVSYGYSQALAMYGLENASWDNVNVQDNTFHSTQAQGALVFQAAPSEGLSYSGNQYYTDFLTGRWFQVAGSRFDLDGWRTVSGESNAAISTFVPLDPGRNVDTYAVHLGIGTTLDDFAREARKQSRFNWRKEYQAKAVNHYIRQSFNVYPGENDSMCFPITANGKVFVLCL